MCLYAVTTIQAVGSTCLHIYFVELRYDFLFVESRYGRQSVARHTWRTDSTLLWCYELCGFVPIHIGMCSLFTHFKSCESVYVGSMLCRETIFHQKVLHAVIYIHTYIYIRIVWICVHAGICVIGAVLPYATFAHSQTENFCRLFSYISTVEPISLTIRSSGWFLFCTQHSRTPIYTHAHTFTHTTLCVCDSTRFR